MYRKTTPLRSEPCQDCGNIFDIYHRFQVRCEPCQVSFRNTRKKTYNLVCQSCKQDFKGSNYRTKKCQECAKTSICKTCKTEYTKENYQHRHYCSARCSNIYKNEIYFGGNYLATLERDSYQCRKCNTKQSPHVHHIDLSGRFKKTERERCNNSMSNLITLCNSCHQELHNEIEYVLVQRHLAEAIELTNTFLEK